MVSSNEIEGKACKWRLRVERRIETDRERESRTDAARQVLRPIQVLRWSHFELDADLTLTVEGLDSSIVLRNKLTKTPLAQHSDADFTPVTSGGRSNRLENQPKSGRIRQNKTKSGETERKFREERRTEQIRARIDSAHIGPNHRSLKERANPGVLFDFTYGSEKTAEKSTEIQLAYWNISSVKLQVSSKPQRRDKSMQREEGVSIGANGKRVQSDRAATNGRYLDASLEDC